MVVLSQVSDSGSPTAPNLSTDNLARPPPSGTTISTFASSLASASRSAICRHAASSPRVSWARCSPTSSDRLRPASTSAFMASHRGPSSSRTRGSAHRLDGAANTSRRFRVRCNCSSTHTTYASRSTAPCGNLELENTARFHIAGTSSASTSRGSNGLSFTRRRESAGRRRTALRMRRPVGAASSESDSPSRERNGRTVL